MDPHSVAALFNEICHLVLVEEVRSPPGQQWRTQPQLTEIRDLVAKYRPDHTSGRQKKAEIGGRETIGSMTQNDFAGVR